MKARFIYLRAFFSKSTIMNIIKVGDTVSTNHGIAKITAIEYCTDDPTYGQDMQQVGEDIKDCCVFDLNNGHWCYGSQLTPIQSNELIPS